MAYDSPGSHPAGNRGGSEGKHPLQKLAGDHDGGGKSGPFGEAGLAENQVNLNVTLYAEEEVEDG